MEGEVEGGGVSEGEVEGGGGRGGGRWRERWRECTTATI